MAWNANWSTHPGEHVAEYMEIGDFDPAAVSKALGVSVSALIAEKVSVDDALARRLETVFGPKAYIWRGLQTSWDKHQKRQS